MPTPRARSHREPSGHAAGPGEPTIDLTAPGGADPVGEPANGQPDSGEPAGGHHPPRDPVRGELRGTAAIHASELPGGFFVRFGWRFLAAYHGRFHASPDAVCLVAGPVGAPSGFLVGTFDNARHYRWLVRHPGPLVRVGLAAVCGRPRLGVDVVRTRGRRYLRAAARLVRRRWAPDTGERGATAGDGAASDAAAPTPVVAVLTHVAVAPHARGTGLGRLLVETFVARARDAGAHEIRLITHVGTPAPAFYRRLGWHSLGERRASDGTLVEEFELVL